MENRRVVVSGLGVVSPFGIGRNAFWTGLERGESGARLIDSFPNMNLPTRFAAQVPANDDQLSASVTNQRIVKTLSRSGKMVLIAAQEALHDAGINFAGIDPFRVATSIGAGGTGLWDTEHADRLLDVFLESVEIDNGLVFNQNVVWANIMGKIHPLTPLRALPNIPTAQIAIMANARGNCQTISTACTSSAQAIGEAFRQIGSGHADVAIAGGGDSMINAYGMVAFSMLGVLSRNNDEWQTASRPFDRRRDGFMLGEGAAIVILEELEHCRNRSGRPYAEIIGYGNTNDAYRLTDEPPQAWGAIKAMQIALHQAGLAVGDVDYINAHGTGTRMNDKIETFAIRSVFGNEADRIPVSSTKSQVGHLVAGAGAVECAACLWALKQQSMPPTINYLEPDAECDLDYVPNAARPAAIRVVLSNSFGFGGQNACLALRYLDSD
jgi:3-oxoacyl-[acyl-carrier-protein] synthase II